MLSILFLLFGYGDKEAVFSPAVEDIIDKAVQSSFKISK